MKLREDLEIRNVAGEKVIVMPNDGVTDFTSLINLNSTAYDIWQAFVGKDFTAADIKEYLLENYEVEEEVAANDSNVFVNQLKQIGALSEC